MQESTSDKNSKLQPSLFFFKKEGGKIKLKPKAKKLLLFTCVLLCFSFVLIDALIKQDRLSKSTHYKNVSEEIRKLKSQNENFFIVSALREDKKSPSKNTKRNRSKYQTQRKQPRKKKLITLFKRSLSIPPGALMRARVLMNASDGPIKLQSTENLILQSTSVIPQNSSFFGTAVSRGNRLFIKLNSLVFPNNSQYSLQAQALDFEDKKIGVRGSRLGNKALKAFGVFSLNVLSQSGMALSKKEYLGGSDSGEVHIKPSLENALLYGASSASSESIKDYSKELKNTPSQVLVKQGRKVLILFTDPIKKINHGG